MKLYLTLKSIPELSNLPWRERIRVWNICARKTVKHWQVWVAYLVCIILICTAGITGNAIEQNFPGTHPFIIVLIISFLHFGTGGLIVTQIITVMARPYIRKERGLD